MTADDAGRPVRRVGDRALLVDCADGAEARRLHAALLANPLPGQEELLPGARTVLVRLTDPRAAGPLARALADLAAAGPVADAADAAGASSAEVVLDTVYDGADLDDVARTLGLSAEALVRAHTDRRWTAAFVGFAPGFAYLEPDGPPWEVPRRATPRTAVPAGSVAVAGPYAAVYPRVSPGGWQLLGRTDAVLWDLGRARPALVVAGTRVRFRPVRPTVTARSAAAVPPGARTAHPVPATPSSALEVVAPGPLSLVEDLGRPGHLHLGVGRSGALDRGAAVRANRLVGNPRGAAVVETVLGGLTVRAHGTQVLAVTGPPGDLTVLTGDGDPRGAPPVGAPFRLGDAERLVVGAPAAGLRRYVAVRGGLGVDAVLGSRSADVLAGLGPPPLRVGDVLPVLPAPGDAVAAWPDPPDPEPAAHGPVEVRVVPGPRDDRVPGGVAALCAATWTVGPDSNRVGLRLTGPALPGIGSGELPSEGAVAGAVQVPPSGLPVVLLADHPVTGGYPVVAVVLDADLDRLGQVRPGNGVRFVVDDDPTGGRRRRPGGVSPRP